MAEATPAAPAAPPDTSVPTEVTAEAEPELSEATFVLGLDTYCDAVDKRLATLDQLINVNGSKKASEAAAKALAKARVDLQDALGKEKRARQALAAASTEQELTVRSNAAAETLEEVVTRRLALQNAAVEAAGAAALLSLQLDRLNSVRAMARTAAAQRDAARAAAAKRLALVATIDDLAGWRADLLAKLAKDGKPVEDQLARRRAAVLGIGGPPAAGAATSRRERLDRWVDARYAVLDPVPPSERPEPPTVDSVAGALAAIAAAEADLAAVPIALRARVDAVAAVLAKPVVARFGLDDDDLKALDTALQTHEKVLDEALVAPPADLTPSRELLENVPPSVWLQLLELVRAARDLDVAKATSGAAERTALLTAVAKATELVAEATEETTKADDTKPEPPDSVRHGAYVNALPFPYGLA